MNYVRVVPRDLFNEGNLLKCLGKLAILLDYPDYPAALDMRRGFEDAGFAVEQSEDDGSIWAQNVMLYVRGHHYHLRRPLNSRRSWPLFMTDPSNPNFDEIDVFDEDSGALSEEMLAFLLG